MQSFIDAVLTNMSAGKNKSAQMASLVQQMEHANVLNRIAMVYVKLNNDRALAKKANKQPALKPEQLFNFLQQLMNQICWAGRRLARSQDMAEAQNQAVGIDFSQDVAAELNVNPMSSQELADTVEQDHFCLSNVHAYLAAKMSYLEDLPMLAVFQELDQITLEDGSTEWKVSAEASTFAEAVAFMDMAVERLAAEQDEQVSKEVATIDFGTLAA